KIAKGPDTLRQGLECPAQPGPYAFMGQQMRRTPMASKKKSPGKAGAKPTRKSPSKRSTAGGKRKKATGSSGSNPLMTDTTFPITAEWEGKPPVKKNSMTVVKLGTKLVPLYSKS